MNNDKEDKKDKEDAPNPVNHNSSEIPNDKHKEMQWEHPLSIEEEHILRPTNIVHEIWRAFKIFLECARGFYVFRNLPNCITVFGSARFHEGHKYYAIARRTGQLLAQQGFAVMTGGGPGLMEATNRGAKDCDGISFGCNIEIPNEQDPNKYLDKWITFKYFFVRKVMLSINSKAFIVMPGGFGTLDEFFEMTTLIQTGKMDDLPVVLMGVDYWQPLVDYMHETMAKHGTIDFADARKILLTDSPKEAIHFIQQHKRANTTD